MRVFGLDLSTRVGHCLFKRPDDPRPFFGTHILPKVASDDIAGRTLPLRRWLRECIQVYKPDCVAFESPLIMMGSKDKLAAFTTAQTMRLQISLAAEVETTAKECGVKRILEVATATAKVVLAGTSRLGTEKKRAMVAAAYRRGWQIADDHQADAGAVALAAYQHFEMLDV